MISVPIVDILSNIFSIFLSQCVYALGIWSSYYNTDTENLKMKFSTKGPNLTVYFIIFIQHADKTGQRNWICSKKVFTVRVKGGMIKAKKFETDAAVQQRHSRKRKKLLSGKDHRFHAKYQRKN